MGDLLDWPIHVRQDAQNTLIPELNLTPSGTSFEVAVAVAPKLFGAKFTFSLMKGGLDSAVSHTADAGVVIALASLSRGLPGHAYHLLGGSYPLRAPNVPDFVSRRLAAIEDVLADVRLWDPWDDQIIEARHGDIRARYERTGSFIVINAR
jgi:hypothetical protein